MLPEGEELVMDKPYRILVGVGASLTFIFRSRLTAVLHRAAVAALFVTASLPLAGWCQVPEFFGIYAEVDGKLAPLIGGRGTFTPNRNKLQLFDASKMEALTTDVAVFEGGDIRFIVFDAAVAETSANLELYKLPYGRNIVTRPDALGQVGGLLGQISGQTPRGQTPTVSPLQKYVIAKTDALKVELLQKPVPGQPQMVQLVPASNLEPGVYCLFVVRSQGGRQMIVGQPFERKGQTGSAETPYCIDLATTGGFGGMMEQSDAQMMRPYYLAKEKYTPCSESNVPGLSSTPTPAAPGGPTSGRAVASPPGTTTYSGNFGHAAQLLLYPDGSFTEQGDKADGSGTYTESGTYTTKADRLVLKGSKGTRAEFLIRGDALYDRLGRRAVWRKSVP